MRKNISSWIGRCTQYALLGGVSMVMLGCSLSSLQAATPNQYDLGAIAKEQIAANHDANREIVAIPSVLVGGAVNDISIIYRYTNVQTNEPKQYASSRWTQHPAELIRFRAQQYLGRYHSVVLTSELESKDTWSLRLMVEDFSQHISSDTDSVGVVQIRATLMYGGHLVGQKFFEGKTQVQTADVQGAAVAIAKAADDALIEMVEWAQQSIENAPPQQ